MHTDLNLSNLESVRNFMIAAGQHDPENPQFNFKDAPLVKLRLKLLLEEVAEHFEALLAEPSWNIIKKQFDLIQQLTSGITEEDLDVNIVEVLDSAVDIEYILCGNAIAFNVPFDKGFKLVHENNMTKIDEAKGKCIKSPEGKILKPEGYTPVNLSVLFD